MKKIVIDIDDTVANTSEFLMDYAIEFDKEKVNGEGIVNSSMNLPRCFNWSSEHTKLFLDTIFDKYVDDVLPVDGAVEVINSLRKAGYKILFVSSRNENQMKEPYKRTLAWLKKNKIEFDKLIVEAKYKGPVIEAENADTFIDDSVGQTTYVADNYDIDVILFSSTNTHYNNITVINNWDEIYNHIMNRESLYKR